MADLETQRLQQQVDELTNKLNGLTNSTNTQTTAANKSAAKLDAFGQAASGAGSALATLASQIYRGQLGAGQFTKALKTTTGAAAAASKNFESTMGKRSGMATAVRGLGIGFTELANIAAEMSDQLFESFQSLTRVGAASADGMAGVFDQLQNFRLSLADLGQLAQLLGANAQSLALFGGTVEQGAKSLGALRKAITTTGLEEQFMGLGMNTQEINESLAGFAAVQSRLGVRQITDYNKVADSLSAYIAEQDAITKLTGATRKQQEEAAQKALAIEQFRAKINQLVAKGDDASLKEANRLMGIFKGLDAVSSDLSAAFAATASGFVTKGPGVTGQLVAQGKLQEIVNNRNIELGQALPMIGNAVEQFNTGVGATLAATGRYNEVIGANYGQLSDAVPILKDFGGNLKTVEDIQAAQRARQEEGVKAQVDLRKAQMDTMQNLQSFINLGVNPATQALNILAKAALEASSTLPGAKSVRGYGQQGTGTLGGSLAATGAGAGAGAVAGVPLGLPGIAIGAITGGLLAKLGYDQFAGGTGSITPEDVIAFGTGTGSRQHFDQLRADVRERALAMAFAYQQQTGQKLNLNSAFRSAEEQAQLQARGAGGRPIAEPGSSLHQQGRALDFNTSDINALERMGLLKEFGFNRLANDPPHIYMQDGGIASGPKSGYQATLHGTEAVVPLPDGKTIPVTMPEMSSQVSMMSEQITRLDELIALMRNANGISHKILQAANN
jgi:hypothetical protein